MVPEALSLFLADQMSWHSVFWITAAFMLPGLICTLLIKEPTVYGSSPLKNIREAVVLPFRAFIARDGWRGALWVLGSIFLYKLGDSSCYQLLYRSRFFADANRCGLQDYQSVGQPGRRHIDGEELTISPALPIRATLLRNTCCSPVLSRCHDPLLSHFSAHAASIKLMYSGPLSQRIVIDFPRHSIIWSIR